MADPSGEVEAPNDREVSVRIESLTKTFDGGEGEVCAVDDVSLDVYRGEFLVLVGPSGCGKTTTLRTIAGLESPTEGRVYIEGEEVTGLDPRERDVSMVFQNYALYPHMTVEGNLSFPLRVRNYPGEEIERRVAETAELLDISDLLDRKPGALSGGQQQRVALGRAIVREPAVFLMDEPLSNLDAKLRASMRTELNELHRRVGETTIYVTHDQAEAMTLGDRIAVMNRGRIRQVGPPQAVYANPADLFVAGFLGEPSTNFFDVALERANPGDGTGASGYRVVSDLFDLPLPRTLAERLDRRDGPENATLGIRPEALADPTLHESEFEHRFEARVKLVEPLGSETIVTLVPPGDDPATSDREFAAAFDPATGVRPGDVIEVAPDLDRLHVFDPATGENLTRPDE